MTSRIQKFRVWDKRNKEFLKESNLSNLFVYGVSAKGEIVNLYQSADSEYVLMQFTGLFDKNKNPIYEGDVVQFENGEKTTGGYKQVAGGNYKVYWDTYKWRLQRIGTERWLQTIDGIGGIANQVNRWEVVGNIHQHPELLKHD